MTIAVFLILLTESFFGAYYYLALLQKNGYRIGECFSKSSVLITVDALSMVASLVILVPSLFFGSLAKTICAVCAWLPTIIAVIVKNARFGSLTLVFTKRVFRLIAAFFAVVTLCYIPAFVVPSVAYFGSLYACCAVCFFFAAACVMRPVEEYINSRYIKTAAEKLNNPNLIKIAVAGSCGKTTVKNILFQMLSKKYSCYVTPSNYNTPLGISKAVTAMPENTQVFIAETGARYEGDIEELMQLVKPDYSILTCILPQHLETFKDMKTLTAEKLKVTQGVKQCFVNDNINNFEQEIPDNVRLLGKDFNVEETKANANGLTFIYSGKGEEIMFETQLLGSHNAINIALAASLALELDVTPALLAESVAELKPLPHRLQLSRNDKNVRIIDDSYNISIGSAMCALNALSLFDGRKAVSVYGIVEGGTAETILNETLGEMIGGVADLVFITGNKYAQSITNGIKQSGRECEILYAKNMEECKKLYGMELLKGDTLLILADLPPQYCI